MDLVKILDDHRKWLCGNGGERANLCRANLRGANLGDANLGGANLGRANLGGANLGRANLRDADLRDADLRDADLRGANLRGANLGGANLGGANLRGANLGGANLGDANLGGANLGGANLGGANLGRANLRDADLRDADLRGANLGGANLGRANLRGANLGRTIISEHTAFFALQCPEEGAFIGWKKCREDVIVKLLIPEDAKRSSATSRKCRASKVKVLEVFGAEYGVSQNDANTIYRGGETVTPDSWDENRWKECSNGIHFFITRQEAEQYN